MAYIKYKEITKYFNFSKSIEKDKLPGYVFDYIFEDETILISYKTLRDHGVFTDKKILLFDNKMTLDSTKEIFTIPYNAISSCSVKFKLNGCEMLLYMDSGYPLRIKFVRISDVDKLKLRLLYNIIQKTLTNQKIEKTELQKLVNDEFDFNRKDK